MTLPAYGLTFIIWE